MRPFPRKMEKTDAESVDDIVAAKRSEAVRLNGIVPRAGMLNMTWMRMPVRAAGADSGREQEGCRRGSEGATAALVPKHS